MTNATNITLYDFPLSVYCQMVRVALAEKGARYQTKPVDITQRGEQFERWYLEINPRGVVPSLVIDGQAHIEAKNILRRMEELLPGPSLIPTGADDRARMEEWMLRSDRIDYAALLYATKVTPNGGCPPLLGRLQRLRDVRANFPELAGPAGERIEELGELLPKLADPAERAALRAEIAREIAELDAALEGNVWLGGDTFCLADAMWMATLARCELQRLTPWEDGSLPNVARYHAALKRRPSYRDGKVVDRMPASLGDPPKTAQASAP